MEEKKWDAIKAPSLVSLVKYLNEKNISKKNIFSIFYAGKEQGYVVIMNNEKP